jgi:hypothetical protein
VGRGMWTVKWSVVAVSLFFPLAPDIKRREPPRNHQNSATPPPRNLVNDHPPPSTLVLFLWKQKRVQGASNYI